MTLPDPARVADIIREVAEAEILPRFRCLTASQIREKKPGQLVTEADVEAEKVLTRRLAELFPARVVGEEAVDTDPGVMAALDGAGAVWVIDPVDGTGNFAQGLARFAVIVALVVDGATVMGWIHDPVPDRMVMAEAGQGAWMAGKRLSVLPEVPLARMNGSIKKGGALAGKVARIGRKGSAAHDYLDLVTGALHFAHFRKLMPWDHAAGVLIHAEAGGYNALLGGMPYRPVPIDAALLLAPGPTSWNQLERLIA